MTEANLAAPTMSASIDYGNQKQQVHFGNLTELQQQTSTRSAETFIFENLKMRPRSMSHHLSSTKIPSRRWLKIQANFWRSLMTFAMNLHDYAPPRPPKAAFIRKIPTNTHPVGLYFYTPTDYRSMIKQGHRYPVVVNFHGGGFCLGHATDDRYWGRVVVQQADAVFVSVNYRRAPEHPFPTPIDDGVDALLYLCKHADALGLDTRRTALSGFSAGANLAFAAPLRLKFHTLRDKKPDSHFESSASSSSSLPVSPPNIEPDPAPNSSNDQLLRPAPDRLTSSFTPHPPPTTWPSNLRILNITSWYPLLDWTMSRAAKKRASVNPKACLPKVFTDLFDYSYLPPPDEAGTHCSPYASPGLAPDHMLREALPNDIQMWLCEWDMLLAEGERFYQRLDAMPGKEVTRVVIPGVPHGWDKSPNPWRDQAKVDKLYEKAVQGLRMVLHA